MIFHAMRRRGLSWLLPLLFGMTGGIAWGDEWHHLDIGFNLGYPDRVRFFGPALEEVERLGIQHVRVYEIFDGYQGKRYQRRLKKALDIVLAHNMIPIISISNVHAGLLPKKSLRKKYVTHLPSSVSSKIGHILAYSNRFPPASLEGYRASIQELVDFLFSTYGKKRVQEWWFEIGNEPDAPLYFWGNPVEFSAMYRVASEVLLANGIRHVGGLGVTSWSVFHNGSDERKADYRAIMKTLAADAEHREFLSFHLYDRSRFKTTPLSGLPDWLTNSNFPVFITEWNVSSRGEVAARLFKQPGAWGAFFIRLLADAAHSGIDRIYIFKLMNYPLHDDLPQLGAFDVNGRPLPWFEEFQHIYEVVRDGYRVEEDGYSLRLRGRHGLSVVLAKSPVALAMPVLYSPLKSVFDAARKLPANQWAVVRVQ